MTIRTFALLLVMLSSVSLSSLAQEVPKAWQEIPDGWLLGGIEAINLEQRRLVISGKEYRIALRARITDHNDAKLSLEDMDMLYVVTYRVDEETGDVLDIKVVVYP